MSARACVATIGLAFASAKREPAFIPAEDDAPLSDPSLNYEPLRSVNYHNAFVTAGRHPVLMAYLDDSLEGYEDERATFNRAAAAFKCLNKGGGNYMMAAGNDVRARFIVSQEDIGMPSLSVFRRKRQATFAGNWTELELRDWVYQELAGLRILETDEDYDAFVKTADKTTVGGLAGRSRSATPIA